MTTRVNFLRLSKGMISDLRPEEMAVLHRVAQRPSIDVKNVYLGDHLQDEREAYKRALELKDQQTPRRILEKMSSRHP